MPVWLFNKKEHPVKNQIKEIVKFAWFPIKLRDIKFNCYGIIWFDSYINTYKYDSICDWVLIKRDIL